MAAGRMTRWIGFWKMASESSELERLSQEIVDSQSHLRGAKSVESFDLATAIEREIGEMEQQRNKLLHDMASSAVEDEQRAAAPGASGPGESLQLTVPSVAGSTESNERIGIIWGRLTPEDVDRARQEVERHRIEALARHARELESLDVEVAEVDSLEQAVDLFMRKFGATAVTA